MRFTFLASPLFLGLILVACGGSTTSSVAPTPVRSPACPATVPVSGDPCPEVSRVECEYGADIHCTQIALCGSVVGTGSLEPLDSPTQSGARWFVESPDPSCAGNSASCGSSFAAIVNGSACTLGDSCTFPEGRCSCSLCYSGVNTQGGQWSCDEWETPKGCPAERPLLGTTCATEDQECDYGPACCDDTDVGPAIKCAGGIWQSAAQSCACGVAVCGAH